MKTISDLNALIPQLTELVLDNPEIGESYYEQDEDGWNRCDYSKSNCVCYEENGWCIEIQFDCCGAWDNDRGDYWSPGSAELQNAWGEVTEITASHYDEDTDEETEFNEEDLKELWSALDKALEDIA